MKTLFLLLSLSLALCAFSQYDIEEVKNDSLKERKFNRFEIKQRIYVGGELGLSFGQGSGYLYLAPLVGFDITDKFSTGVSGMYQLFRGGGVSYYSYGGGIFARYRPIQQLILQTEFDYFNTNDFSTSGYPRTNVPAFMTGLGYAGGGGGSVYYQILLMYDLIGDKNMPLPPIIFPHLHLKLGLIWHLGN